MESTKPNRKFDHEKLVVYQQELEFVRWVTVLFGDVKESDGVRLREVCDQLDRASLSMLLNTAEGNGKRRRTLRAKFFDDSRGSATECAACLDALIAKGACSEERIEKGKEHLLGIVSMLTRLVDMFDKPNSLREKSADYETNTVSDKNFEEEKEKEEEEDLLDSIGEFYA